MMSAAGTLRYNNKKLFPTTAFLQLMSRVLGMWPEFKLEDES